MKNAIRCFAVLLWFSAWAHPLPAQVTIDFETFPDGTPIPDDTFLNTQFFTSHGLTFPDGLIIERCASTGAFCIQAKSGMNAAVTPPPPGVEFRYLPFVIEFNGPQKFVSLYVNGHRTDQPGKMYTATLEAFTSSGVRIASQTKTFPFTSGSNWPTQLRVDDSQGRISRVVLSGGSASTPTDNWLVIDDLTFERSTPPGPDTIPPTVAIIAPVSGSILTNQNVDVIIRATDNLRLQNVEFRIVHLPTGRVIHDFPAGNICGAGTSCPSTFVEGRRRLYLTLNGEYEITARATDVAGNLATDAVRRFTLALPPPPPRVFVYKVEFNQAIQSVLENPYSFGRVGRIIPNKDLVVRYYLFAEGARRFNYSASLIVRIEKEDGSIIRADFSPNTQTESITVEPDPGDNLIRGEKVIEQRADVNRSLNFVIPGEWLNNASFMELRLWDSPRNLSVIQHIGISNDTAILGLNIISISRRGPNGDPVPFDEIERKVVKYLERAFPVSEVQILHKRLFPYRGENKCKKILRRIWRVFGGDDAPRKLRGRGTWTTVLGVLRDLKDCSGYAYIGSPDEPIGETAITEPWGDVAAQEIGHTMGLIHASNDHGEAGGGDWEPWPYPHGAIGPGWNNFGTIVETMQQPIGNDPGEWKLKIIDPCPTSDVSERFPCSIPDNQMPHDFMSYGSSSTNLDPFITLFHNWVSDVTYRRIYGAIKFRSFGTATLSSPVTQTSIESTQSVGALERIEAMTIDADILEDGTIEMYPIMRKLYPRSMIDEAVSGPYTLFLLDDSRNVLLEQSFNLKRETSPVKLIRLTVPYVEGVRSLIIEDSLGIIHEETASPNPPRVRVISPNGGEVLQSGTHLIQWEASDPDGDVLEYMVQYSPDNGRSWQGVAFFEDDGNLSADLNVDELIPGNAAIIRVTASDGFNTSVDISDAVFSLGTADQSSFIVAAPVCATTLPESCTVRIPLTIDLSGATPVELLGSFSGKLSWNPQHLRYTGNSGLQAGFTGAINESDVANGELIFNGANATGADGKIEFLTVDFEVIGNIGDADSLNLAFSAMSAAYSFNNLLPRLDARFCYYTIAPAGVLGDVNGDGLVNSTDALIVLSYDVDLEIDDANILSRLEAGFGDVNQDGVSNSTDALIILSFDVGLEVSVPLGTTYCPQ